MAAPKKPTNPRWNVGSPEPFPPVWTGAPSSLSLTAGQTYNFAPYASDQDSSVLTFSLVNPASGYSITTSGLMTAGPATATVTVRVSDGGRTADTVCSVTIQTVQSGITRLTPSGPAYATEAETTAAISAESVKAYNDPAGKPLPLVGHWHRNTLPLSWQRTKIQSGVPIMPWVNWYRTLSVGGFQATAADADMQWLASNNLPIVCLFGNQWQTDIISPTYNYVRTTLAETPALPVKIANITSATVNGTTSVTFTTDAAHGIETSTLKWVWLRGFTGGWTSLNGNGYEATVIDTVNFSIAVNGSGFGAFSGAPELIRRNPAAPNLSPLGGTAPWAAAGNDWANNAVTAHIQSIYPSPGRAFFYHNNEASFEVEPQDLATDIRFTQTNNDLNRKVATHYGYADKWNAWFSGFKSRLNAAWQSATGFGAYNPNHTRRFRYLPTWHTAEPLDPSNTNRLTFHWYAYDSGVEEVYDNYWEWSSSYPNQCKAPWLVQSPQSEAMIMLNYAEKAANVNPDYWNELIFNDGEFESRAPTGDKLAKYLEHVGPISRTPTYFKGWTQYCMWIARPRVVREYRDAGALILGTAYEDFWNVIMDITCHVHQDATLRRFWKLGTLVENTAIAVGDHPHPYQRDTTTDGSWTSPWENLPKWYHLKTNLDPVLSVGINGIYTLNENGENAKWPVYTLAHVIGSAPNREWLVYAHSTGTQGDANKTLTNVVVTIPNYQNVTLPTVPVEGAFYHIVE